MLKREITYEDFNGNEVTETFYFNISKPELVEMEVEYPEGFSTLIKRIIEEKNHKELINHFKAIVLHAYGQKSEDGKRFIKSDILREEFSQTAAYNVLFMDLATNDDAAASFLKGVLPSDMVAEIDKSAPKPPTPITSKTPS